ncbi:MAG TPA: dihydrolipoamide acetyltransferase family protein [Acidimicrobiales bacterium]
MPDITMPQLGETVTEGTIIKWFKTVGDMVAEDEPLFEVSTDKVDSEVPSPFSGTLTEIRVEEGDTVDVGEVIGVIGVIGEGGREGVAAAESAPTESPPETPEAPPAGPAAEPIPDAPVAAEPSPGPAASVEPAEAPALAGAGGGGRLLSPVVRRLINENNLDPDQIAGTGAGGRITRNDVVAHLEGRGGAAPAAPPAHKEVPAKGAPAAAGAPKPPASRAPAAPTVTAGGRDEAIPFSNIRKRTGEHMVMSMATSPHVLVAYEVDFENVDRVRAARKVQFKDDEGFSLTYLPFVSRAVVDAIREYPHVNASVGDGELIIHHDVNLGIAVDLDFNGLIVPVIQGADSKRLRAIAREVKDLADRARSKKLNADDISGGTFTITNPGPFGTSMTAAVINQPQVAILSTDGVSRKPVAVDLPDGSEGIAIHSVGNLCLSFDHRAFDGAYASAFVRHVKEIIETRDWEAEIE